MVGFGGMISFGFTFGGNTGGGGGTVNAADNGLSLETASTVRLGQAVGTPGDPAILAGNAEIPLGGFSFNFIDKNVNAQFLIGLAQTNGINFFYDSNLQGAFMAFNFADLFTGAGFAFSNDAAANITFVNQTDTVMLFTPAANIQAGVAGTTRSITLFGANDTSVQPNLVVLQNGQISLTGNSDDTVPAKLNFINNADASTASIAWGNSQLIFDAFELVFNPDPTAMAQFNGKIVTSQSLQTGDPGSGSGVWFLGKEITVASVALVTTKYVETKIDGVIVKLGVVA